MDQVAPPAAVDSPDTNHRELLIMEPEWGTNAFVEVEHRYLNAFYKMWDAGVEIGPILAMAHCVSHDLTFPPWLGKAALELLSRETRASKPQKRGRAASVAARFRQDMIHFDRWGTVEAMRQYQKDFQHEVELLKEYKGATPRHREHCTKTAEWLGRSWDRAYECASLYLKGNISFASPSTIKKSYQLVGRRLRNGGKEASRYLDVEYQVLMAIGMEDLLPDLRLRHPIYELR